MSTGYQSSVQAIENIHSKKIFILLGYPQPDRMMIINPEGKILTVPEGLFHSPYDVSKDNYADTFTKEQILTIHKYVEKKPRSKTVTKKTVRSSAYRPSRALEPCEWSCAQVTFYKHKIDPLLENQSFSMTVEGLGKIVMTRTEFEKHFSDVVLSPSYSQEGSFVYPATPDKIKRFVLQR